MGAIWSEESYFKKEMERWDRPKRDGGMNRNGYEPFPRMLYKAQRNPLNGRFEVAVAQDEISLDKTRVLLDAQAFNTSCQLIVNNEDELERKKREGWRESQAEAMAWHDGELDRLAHAAAARNVSDRNMSEKAKAEADVIDRSIPGHVGEIPEQPRVKKPATQKQLDAMAKARAARGKKAEA